jgi:hypothetical protein
MRTETFAEGLWDKVYDSEIIAALGRVLGDAESDVRRSAVEFFTIATSQGALHSFHVKFILTSSQLDSYPGYWKQ